MENLELIPAATKRSEFWQGKRVLVTGHTGFKGSWLTLWLQRLGADVVGISLPPPTEPSLFLAADIEKLCRSHFSDVRDAARLAPLIKKARPQVVFHLAAQSLVRRSYREPLATLDTNVMGTANVLDALRGLECVRVAVIVTTDKVYRNHEWAWPYREIDALGGHDPYSASKAASEIVVDSFRDAFLAAQGVAIGSARAGNVIGGGDWSEDRLIPDAVRAWQRRLPVAVRRPEAIRPWQHVLEPLAGYLELAQALWHQPKLAGPYNFGPNPAEAATVRAVLELARAVFGQGEVDYCAQNEGPHEAGWLALETAKSRSTLGSVPRWDLSEAVRRTMQWYLAHYQGADARALCEAEILAYEVLR